METNCHIQMIMLGESGVGKTSLRLRFDSGIFRERLPGTAIDYCKKTMKIKGKEVKVTVWDIGGKELYRSLGRNYYKQVDGVLLVYDVQNAATFLKLSKWLIDLKAINENAIVIIVGNKIEDLSKKVENGDTINDFVQEKNLEHLEVSAKSGENVVTIFHYLAEKILIAKGFLPRSTGHLLPKTEIESEENSENTSILRTIITEQLKFHPEPNQELKDLLAFENVSSTCTNEPSYFNELSESDEVNGMPAMKAESRYYSTEDLCSEDSAECAMTFFGALGESVL